jgi:flagellar biosynthesis protein FlhG
VPDTDGSLTPGVEALTDDPRAAGSGPTAQDGATMSASLAYEPLGASSPLTVAVTSGKGGVGKSQLVASLAIVLGREGHRPLVVDADVGCGDLDVLFNIRPEVDLRSVLSGAVSPERAVTTANLGDVEIGFVPAPSANRDGSELSRGEQLGVLQAVDRVGWRYRTVLVDTGAGVSRNPMFFAAAADRVLVVTTPEPTSMQDAYAAIKVLHQAHGVTRFELVVNQVRTIKDGKRVYARLCSVIDRFLPVELGLIGILPRDERVERAVMARQPVAHAYPVSPFSHAVRGIARRLMADGQDRPGGQLRWLTTRPADEGAAAPETTGVQG